MIVALLCLAITGKIPESVKTWARSYQANSYSSQKSSKRKFQIEKPSIPSRSKSWEESQNSKKRVKKISKPASRSLSKKPPGRVENAFQNIALWDQEYALEVPLFEKHRSKAGNLFGKINGKVHSSYQETYDFCQLFNPMNRKDSEVSERAIDQYLGKVSQMKPIAEVLRLTNTSVRDLKRTWFREGRGFEHVVCGEVGGRPGGYKLGGYHFWYMHYRYEQDGSARYLGEDYGSRNRNRGLKDNKLVTGDFSWDVDGPGGQSPLEKKPKGGFSTEHSVAAILALGHAIIYSNAQDSVLANINQKKYRWTFYTKGKSMRTLWPSYP